MPFFCDFITVPKTTGRFIKCDNNFEVTVLSSELVYEFLCSSSSQYYTCPTAGHEPSLCMKGLGLLFPRSGTSNAALNYFASWWEISNVIFYLNIETFRAELLW